MRPYRIIYEMHKWVGLVSAVLLLNMSVTGLLLLEKKRFDWLQPPTQTGTAGTQADFISIQELLDSIRHLQHPDFRNVDAIDRIDFRPNKRVFKVRSQYNNTEIQVDAISGRVLSIAARRSDLVETIHDGSWFGPWTYAIVMPVTAIANVLLIITGCYLWLRRLWLRRRKRVT